MANPLTAIGEGTSSIRREIAETLAPRIRTPEDVLPPLMILLTIVTGIVDALAYLRLGHVFVANMTGNVVFLGFAAAGAHGLSVPGSLLALGCFLPGGATAGRLAGRFGENRLRLLRAGAAVQLFLCIVAVAVAAAAGDELGTAGRYALIALLALAMGVQNATARRVAVPELATTVLTLTLTGIAADSWLGGGSGAKTARRVVSVTAMLLGAVIGALLLLHLAPVAPIALASGILAVVLGAADRGSRQAQSQVRPPVAIGQSGPV
jgi:uncharacterized membrane protein YoaK (UPF0700 family)